MTGDSRSQPSIVERLRSSEPLPACPFDKLSPHYLTMPDDKPCPFCGQENTLDGPDKCRGADTRVMGEAADRIEELEGALKTIADHPDRQTGDSGTYAVGWAFWNIQNIARAALNGEAGKP